MGSATARHPGGAHRSNRCRSAVAELGPVTREVDFSGVASGCAVAVLGSAGGGNPRPFTGAAATSRSGRPSGHRSSWARANVGCSRTGGARLAHCSRRPDMGRRATSAVAPGRAGSFVGRLGRRAAGTHLGIPRGCSLILSATTCSVMGAAQAGGPDGPAAGPLVG